MRKLIMGIVDFRERMLPQYQRRFEALALSQAPDALFVTCSDSRVVPDLLASTEPGDLFTMRNVGNLIPPATAEGISIGDLSEASAIVCGHSECGAMKAVMASDRRQEAPNLAKWLHHATMFGTLSASTAYSGWRGVSSGTRGRARCDAETVRSTFSTQRACAA